MELKTLFNRIDREIKTGDIKDACGRVGVSSQVYTNLRKRETGQEMTSKEQEVLTEVINILDERQARLGQLLGNANESRG